jgi:hypothetical protein
MDGKWAEGSRKTFINVMISYRKVKKSTFLSGQGGVEIHKSHDRGTLRPYKPSAVRTESGFLGEVELRLSTPGISNSLLILSFNST